MLTNKQLSNSSYTGQKSDILLLSLYSFKTNKVNTIGKTLYVNSTMLKALQGKINIKISFKGYTKNKCISNKGYAKFITDIKLCKLIEEIATSSKGGYDPIKEKLYVSVNITRKRKPVINIEDIIIQQRHVPVRIIKVK